MNTVIAQITIDPGGLVSIKNGTSMYIDMDFKINAIDGSSGYFSDQTKAAIMLRRSRGTLRNQMFEYGLIESREINGVLWVYEDEYSMHSAEHVGKNGLVKASITQVAAGWKLSIDSCMAGADVNSIELILKTFAAATKRGTNFVKRGQEVYQIAAA